MASALKVNFSVVCGVPRAFIVLFPPYFTSVIFLNFLNSSRMRSFPEVSGESIFERNSSG